MATPRPIPTETRLSTPSPTSEPVRYTKLKRSGFKARTQPAPFSRRSRLITSHLRIPFGEIYLLQLKSTSFQYGLLRPGPTARQPRWSEITTLTFTLATARITLMGKSPQFENMPTALTRRVHSSELQPTRTLH